MTPDNGEIIVKDLGSTNGIRINGQRVEKGRLRPGDELSIAHIRYRFEDGNGQEMTMAEPLSERNGHMHGSHGANRPDDHGAGFRLRAATSTPAGGHPIIPAVSVDDQSPLAAAVREMLPAGVADKCRIQVIVQMPHEAAEEAEGCRPDSSL